MPEGLMTAAGVTGAVHDDPDHKPEPSAEAPRDWTWDRKGRKWKPRQRGPIVWKEGADDGAGPAGSVPGEGASGDLGSGTEHGERDPDPSWLRDDKQDDKPGGKRKKFSMSDVPREAQDDLAGVLGMTGTLLLPLLEAIDPYCGRAFAENYQRIAEATMPLVFRSDKVVKFMTGTGGGFMDWLGLGFALMPVATAVIQHHVTRTVQVVRTEQGVQVMRVQRGHEQHHGDNLTPPAQPEYNYAA